MRPRYRNAGIVLGSVAIVLLAVHQSREAHAGYFEVLSLQDSERDFYMRLSWMWQICVYLPALAIGFFAYGTPTVLGILTYTLSATILLFDGHGPYQFEDSAASLLIFGDTQHHFLPTVGHGEWTINILGDVGKVILFAGILAWLGSWIRRRLNNRLNPVAR